MTINETIDKHITEENGIKHSIANDVIRNVINKKSRIIQSIENDDLKMLKGILLQLKKDINTIIKKL